MTMYFWSLLPRACLIGTNMAYRDQISDLYSRSVIYKSVCQICVAIFYLISHTCEDQISTKGIGEYKCYPIEQKAFVCAFEICIRAQMSIFTWSLTHTNEKTMMKLNQTDMNIFCFISKSKSKYLVFILSFATS